MSDGHPKKQATVQIYGLTCPITNLVRYVGKANDAETRLRGHLFARKSKSSPLYCWLRQLCTNGLKPELMILETVEFDRWQEREIAWIAHYHRGGGLLNRSKGGNQPDRSLMNCADRRLYELSRNLSQELRKTAKSSDIAGKRLHAKLLLNSMALSTVYPNRTPPKWRSLQWDENRLGALTPEVLERFLSPRLLNRLMVA